VHSQAGRFRPRQKGILSRSSGGAAAGLCPVMAEKVPLRSPAQSSPPASATPLFRLSSFFFFFFDYRLQSPPLRHRFASRPKHPAAPASTAWTVLAALRVPLVLLEALEARLRAAAGFRAVRPQPRRACCWCRARSCAGY